MTEVGVLVRAWRYLFARDAHSECARAIGQERLARQWEREEHVRLIRSLQDKLCEMADPGISYRFQATPKPKPAAQAAKKDEPEMLPGLG